MTKKKTDGVTV